MPTLLDLLGCSTPRGLMGRSFAALVRGAPASAPDEWSTRPLHSESWGRCAFTATGAAERPTPTHAVRRGAHKLIRFPDGDSHRWAYYDLERDPDEQEDLYAADPQAAGDLQALLEAYASSTARLREELTRTPEEGEADWAPDAEREQALRDLGYIDPH